MPRYEIRDEETGEPLGTVVGDIGVYWDASPGDARSFQLVRLDDAEDDGTPTR